MPEPRLSSLEAELSVIGGLFVEPERLDEVAAIVSADDFTLPLHRKAFDGISALVSGGVPVDWLTVAEHLESAGTLGEGDFASIGVIVRDTLSAANVSYYARIVRDRARRRKIVDIAAMAQRSALADGDAEKTLLALRTALDALDSGKISDGLVPISELLSGCIDVIDQRYHGIAPQGMATELSDLDAILHGLQPGKLYVVAGRPAMGKSVLGLQFSAACAIRHRKPAAFFSAEMPSSEQVERLISALGLIDLDAIQTGKLHDDDWPRLTAATAALAQAGLWFDETPAPALADILSKARRLHRMNGPIGMVVVDHAGLVEGVGETREQRQASVGKSLKALAKELSCPVIALLQLNRKLEERADKRPLLSDGRDSGEWEQSADVWAGVYRDEVYSQDSPDKGCAELLIRKHRGGKLGAVALKFSGEYSRFESLAGGLPSWRAPVAPMRRARGIDL